MKAFARDCRFTFILTAMKPGQSKNLNVFFPPAGERRLSLLCLWTWIRCGVNLDGQVPDWEPSQLQDFQERMENQGGFPWTNVSKVKVTTGCQEIISKELEKRIGFFLCWINTEKTCGTSASKRYLAEVWSPVSHGQTHCYIIPCTCKDTALLQLESFFAKWLNVLMKWITGATTVTHGWRLHKSSASDLVIKLKLFSDLKPQSSEKPKGQ